MQEHSFYRRLKSETCLCPLAVANLYLSGGCSFVRIHVSHANAATAALPPVACAASESELDIVSKFSEVVPDTVVGDDFERWAQ